MDQVLYLFYVYGSLVLHIQSRSKAHEVQKGEFHQQEQEQEKL